MLTYGELIHFYREKEFVNEAGKYIDDDIDTFASPETVWHIARLENQLFKLYGWTMRAFVHNALNRKNNALSRKYVVLMQVMASCGHDPIEKVSKVHAAQPSIEIYP